MNFSPDGYTVFLWLMKKSCYLSVYKDCEYQQVPLITVTGSIEIYNCEMSVRIEFMTVCSDVPNINTESSICLMWQNQSYEHLLKKPKYYYWNYLHDTVFLIIEILKFCYCLNIEILQRWQAMNTWIILIYYNSLCFQNEEKLLQIYFRQFSIQIFVIDVISHDKTVVPNKPPLAKGLLNFIFTSVINLYK